MGAFQLLKIAAQILGTDLPDHLPRIAAAGDIGRVTGFQIPIKLVIRLITGGTDSGRNVLYCRLKLWLHLNFLLSVTLFMCCGLRQTALVFSGRQQYDFHTQAHIAETKGFSLKVSKSIP